MHGAGKEKEKIFIIVGVLYESTIFVHIVGNIVGVKLVKSEFCVCSTFFGKVFCLIFIMLYRQLESQAHLSLQ